MLGVLCFILGGAATVPVTYYVIRLQHGNKMLTDENRYKTAWSNALDQLVAGGQLSEKQRAAITPAISTTPADRGKSYDRRMVEITRAEAGLPPDDDLAGMESYDRRMVLQARIKNGTDKPQD